MLGAGGGAAAASTSKRPHDEVDDAWGDAQDEDADLDMPTDAEATIMLLRAKLYPDPAAAAAAAAAAKQGRHAKRSRGARGPSRATAAAVTAAAAAAAAARQLPPIILKTQLYTVLEDRTAVDRELEQLRQQGRVRVFKLAMGADEYVVMLAQDYASTLDGLINKHQQQAQQQAQQAPGAGSSSGADGAAAAAATLQLFRDRVVPACHDSSISRSRLLELLRAAPAPRAPGAPPPQAAAAARQQAAAARAGAAGEVLLEQHLLAAEVVTRDGRRPDAYLLTVPGAAAFVRSVLAGRQELLQLLARKKYQEALEKELSCVKLRGGCCLTPAFIIRDLQGRGLVAVTDTTSGPLVRLVPRK